MLSKRANRDTAWFSMIDGEWPALKAAFEAWLLEQAAATRALLARTAPAA